MRTKRIIIGIALSTALLASAIQAQETPGFEKGDRTFTLSGTVDEQFIAGPDAGVRIFLNDTTFVHMGIEYQFLFEDADDAKANYDDGRFVYGVGMGLKW
jgi:hypothetical protein